MNQKGSLLLNFDYQIYPKKAIILTFLYNMLMHDWLRGLVLTHLSEDGI